MGQTLIIFQGLDRVRTIVFARPCPKKQLKNDSAVGWTDTQLYRRLRRMSGDEVEASRSLLEFIRFFKRWRSVEAWLRQKQVDGSISKRAQILLRAVMEKRRG